MTKLEEIARAICDFTGQHHWGDMAADRGQLREFVRQGGYDVNEPTKDDCLEAARRILTTLKTPTPAMIEAGITAAENAVEETRDSYETYRTDTPSDSVLPIYRAMIAAADDGGR